MGTRFGRYMYLSGKFACLIHFSIMNLLVPLEEDSAFNPDVAQISTPQNSPYTSQIDLFSADLSPVAEEPPQSQIKIKNATSKPAVTTESNPENHTIMTVKVPKEKQKMPKTTSVAKKKPNTRCRNFTEEEVETILREAGKKSKLLRGRFQPRVTSEIKKKVWIEVADVVNKVNCVGDRDWQSIRKKWQDLTSAARQKYREVIREQKKNGRGPSSTRDFFVPL